MFAEKTTDFDPDALIKANNEKKRLKALNSYQLLDTAEENEFGRLVELTKLVCDVPIAAISLIDANRQWFKAKTGISLDETSREISFCNYAIQQHGIYEIENAIEDDRFRNNPLVTSYPKIRYYAGYPLIDPDGYMLGTLCIIDLKPRKLNEMQKQALSLLAAQVMSLILSRKINFDRNHFEEVFMRSIDMVCLAGIDGFFKKVNPAFSVVLGWTQKELTERPYLDFVHPEDRTQTISVMNEFSLGIRTVNFRNRYLTKSGEYKVLSWVANPDASKGLIYAIARDNTETITSEQQLMMAEKKFRDVFENSPDAIFVEDSAGNILDVNIAGAALQGDKKENLVGINIRQLVPKNKFVRLLGDYKKLFFGAVRTVESSVWSATKGEIPVEISGKKIIYGDTTALLLLVRDVSERKKIETERANAVLEKNRLREEQIKLSIQVQETERNRIAAEMHDEVGAGLSRISILGQVIKTSIGDPKMVASNIEKILASSKEVQENISEIIWAMDPKNDTLENLLSFINYFTSEFLEDSSIRFKIDLPSDIPSMMIDGKTRRNIFLVIKESLNNIVKYSEATSVSVIIRLNNDQFSAIISDNGIGFDVSKTSRFSNGMRNMKKRALDINGVFKIVSSKLAGTAVYLHVPIDSCSEVKNQ